MLNLQIRCVVLSLIISASCEEIIHPNVTTKIDLAESNITKIKTSVFNHRNVSTIDEIHLNNSTELKENVLNNSQIQVIPEEISNNYIKLKVVSLTGNGIEKLPRNIFAKNPDIEEIFLFENRLTDLNRTLVNLKKLRVLDLSRNKLENITGQLPASLKFLNMSENEFQDISEDSLSNLTDLEELDLSNNKIKVVESQFSNLQNLQKIFVNNNRIAEITNSFFSNLSKLETINLGYNQINYIEDGAFETQKNLKNLSLNHNTLTELPSDLFKNLRSIKFINLSNNNITSIPRYLFLNTIKLNMLDLTANSLEFIQNNTFENVHLTNLQLVGNPWNCDCNLIYIFQIWKGIMNHSETYCALTNKTWLQINWQELCPSEVTTEFDKLKTIKEENTDEKGYTSRIIDNTSQRVKIHRITVNRQKIFQNNDDVREYEDFTEKISYNQSFDTTILEDDSSYEKFLQDLARQHKDSAASNSVLSKFILPFLGFIYASIDYLMWQL